MSQQICEQLISYIHAGVPILLWGPPGIGKTATVNSIARRTGQPIVTLIGSIHEPVDFSGWPVMQDGQLKMATPSWVRELEGGGILFLDEITNCPPSVQAALLRVVLERVVGEFRLPENVRIIAAANPSDTATDAYELRPALANRFAHLNFPIDVEGWVNHFPSYWNEPPTIPGVPESRWAIARALVASFIHRRPDLLIKAPETTDRYAWPSPRSWDHASRLVALYIDSGPDSYASAVASCVGDAAAVEFINWAKKQDLPDPEQLLRDPSRFVCPDSSDAQFAIVAAVTAAVQSNLTPERWQALAEVLLRIKEDDIAAFGASKLVHMHRILSPSNPRLRVPNALLDRLKDLMERTGLLQPVSGGHS